MAGDLRAKHEHGYMLYFLHLLGSALDKCCGQRWNLFPFCFGSFSCLAFFQAPGRKNCEKRGLPPAPNMSPKSGRRFCATATNGQHFEPSWRPRFRDPCSGVFALGTGKFSGIVQHFHKALSAVRFFFRQCLSTCLPLHDLWRCCRVIALYASVFAKFGTLPGCNARMYVGDCDFE